MDGKIKLQITLLSVQPHNRFELFYEPFYLFRGFQEACKLCLNMQSQSECNKNSTTKYFLSFYFFTFISKQGFVSGLLHKQSKLYPQRVMVGIFVLAVVKFNIFLNAKRLKVSFTVSHSFMPICKHIQKISFSQRLFEIIHIIRFEMHMDRPAV